MSKLTYKQSLLIKQALDVFIVPIQEWEEFAKKELELFYLHCEELLLRNSQVLQY